MSKGSKVKVLAKQRILFWGCGLASISLCMIVKNEEEVLRRCLKSIASVVDEIIVVDTGSTDNTKNIAAEFTDKIFDFKWVDDFSAARNFSFSLAKSDFIMWLDADDVVHRYDAEKIKQLKQRLPLDIGVVYMKYIVGFDENGKPNFSYFRERIVRRCPQAVWKEPVHEAIVPFGKTICAPIAIIHRKNKAANGKRNLEIMEKYLSKGEKVSARFLYYYARELMFDDQIENAVCVFNKFLKRTDAWYVDKISACRDLYRCKKQKKGKADVEILFRSFNFAPPVAEVLCEIGQHFFEQNQLKIAAYWYQAALDLNPEDLSGFCEEDCKAFIPLLQLCVIFDRLGDKKLAAEFNERAAALKPEHPACKFNRRYFKNFL